MTINCRLFFVVVVMELSLFGIVKTHGQVGSSYCGAKVKMLSDVYSYTLNINRIFIHRITQ